MLPRSMHQADWRQALMVNFWGFVFLREFTSAEPPPRKKWTHALKHRILQLQLQGVQRPFPQMPVRAQPLGSERCPKYKWFLCSILPQQVILTPLPTVYLCAGFSSTNSWVFRHRHLSYTLIFARLFIYQCSINLAFSKSLKLNRRDREWRKSVSSSFSKCLLLGIGWMGSSQSTGEGGPTNRNTRTHGKC